MFGCISKECHGKFKTQSCLSYHWIDEVFTITFHRLSAKFDFFFSLRKGSHPVNEIVGAFLLLLLLFALIFNCNVWMLCVLYESLLYFYTLIFCFLNNDIFSHGNKGLMIFLIKPCKYEYIYIYTHWYLCKYV